jgi:ubiquinone/menaquinone biosynthesis C-methylase UbiE
MEAEQLRERYYGDRAHSYEEMRKSTSNWIREDEIMSELLAGLRPASLLLDVPVGTGRFLELYRKRGLKAVGVDASTAMLSHARDAGGHSAELKQADIRTLPFTREHFDVAVCIRFLNWVAWDDVEKAMSELLRVTRKYVIFGVKTYSTPRLMKIYTPRGFVRFLRQLKHRLYVWRNGDGFVYHEEDRLQTLIRSVNVKVVDRKLVTSRPNGVDYFVYMVEKES